MTPPDPPPDAALVARLRAGDDAALDALYRRYEGPLFRFLLGVLRDHHKAEDALQETFVQAIRKADAAAPEAFRGWLFSVAHQQAILLLRREKRAPAAAADDVLAGAADAADAPDELLARGDDARAVRELLAALPAGQRDVIRLRVYDGLRFKEVADRLGCPVNTALARMHDGVKKLRELWEGRGHA